MQVRRCVCVSVCLRTYLHINTLCEKIAKFKMKRSVHTNCCIEKERLPPESVDFYAHPHTDSICLHLELKVNQATWPNLHNNKPHPLTHTQPESLAQRYIKSAKLPPHIVTRAAELLAIPPAPPRHDRWDCSVHCAHLPYLILCKLNFHHFMIT